MSERLILSSDLCPGDIVVLTAAVRDLHLSHPGRFVTDVRTQHPDLWLHNPFITTLPDSTRTVRCDYPLIHASNQLPYHFIHGYRMDLAEKLGLDIEAHASTGDVYLSNAEKGAPSLAEEMGTGADYWLISSGGKTDFTNKWWDPDRFQDVVDHYRGRIRFVQVGARGDVHPPLRGVVNLVGRTDLRELIRLVYGARGVVCGVTLLMHLAAAVEAPGARARPCVVVAGGRESNVWEQYQGHRYVHRVGALSCCGFGGCWRSRVEALGDGDEQDSSLCVNPVRLESGRALPLCMHKITSADIIREIETAI